MPMAPEATPPESSVEKQIRRNQAVIKCLKTSGLLREIYSYLPVQDQRTFARTSKENFKAELHFLKEKIILPFIPGKTPKQINKVKSFLAHLLFIGCNIPHTTIDEKGEYHVPAIVAECACQETARSMPTTQAELDKMLRKPSVTNCPEFRVLNALNHGANPNIRSKWGAPILYSTTSAAADYPMILLAYGANPNLQDKDYSPRTALHSAIVNRDRFVLFLNYGADVETRCPQTGRSILHDVCQLELESYILNKAVLLEHATELIKRGARARSDMLSPRNSSEMRSLILNAVARQEANAAVALGPVVNGGAGGGIGDVD